MLLGLFLINQVSESLKNSKTFWLASALVEAGAGKGSGSCMSPRLRNAVQHFQSN